MDWWIYLKPTWCQKVSGNENHEYLPHYYLCDFFKATRQYLTYEKHYDGELE